MAKRLLAMLAERGMSVEEWFRLMDGSASASGRTDGRVTTRELHTGMRAMAEEEDIDSEYRRGPLECVVEESRRMHWRMGWRCGEVEWMIQQLWS